MLPLLSSLALAAGLATAPVDSTTEIRREDLMAALRNGGYTVILRHARTDYSFKEEISVVPKERSAQRNLSDDGVRDAALMGVVFRKYGISFGEIIASPMYRAVETAEMAAGKPTTTMLLRTFPTTPEQGALVKTAPARGTNRLLVTHHFVIETHVPGIRPGDIKESEAAVVRHNADGSIELAGRISLDDWRALASPSQATAQTQTAALVPGHGAPASAATNIATAAIPDTHAGHLARDYIAAFNSGSPDTMRSFIESSMVANPARPTDERLKGYAKLFEDHGPLSVSTVVASEATQVILGMRSKRGNVRLTVKSSDAEPMRVTSVTFAYGEAGGHS